MLFADFPNSKFWFPEFVSSYAWHVTIHFIKLSTKTYLRGVCYDLNDTVGEIRVR